MRFDELLILLVVGAQDVAHHSNFQVMLSRLLAGNAYTLADQHTNCRFIDLSKYIFLHITQI